MSDTDKTKPLVVRMRQGDWPVEVVHDHTTGVCDLAPEDSDEGWDWSRNCYRTFGIHTDRRETCSNKRCMCHWNGDWAPRRVTRRRDRRKRFRELRRAIDEYGDL